MKQFTLSLVILALAASAAQAQLRLSFVGADNQPLATFDETLDDAVTFDIELLRCEPVDGVEWYFGNRARAHYESGYPGLEDTGPWYQCGSYPGGDQTRISVSLCTAEGLMIGTRSTEPESELHELVGIHWDGYQPMDFSYVFVHYRSAARQDIPGWIDTPVPGTGCQRYFLIPINWVGVPVPAGQSTWGQVKSLYDKKGD